MVMMDVRKQATSEDLQRVAAMDEGCEGTEGRYEDQTGGGAREGSEEQDVMMRLEEVIEDLATGEKRNMCKSSPRGDERQKLNEVCRKGKGKGNGGKGERGSSRGLGGKGIQQCTKTTKGEEEPEEGEQDERVRVVPNMGAGGTSDLDEEEQGKREPDEGGGGMRQEEQL